MLKHEELTSLIIKTFFEVYNELGYGFLESVYEKAMLFALLEAGLKVETQVPIKVFFRGKDVGKYFADMVVNDCVILELKAASAFTEEHELQLSNYLKAITPAMQRSLIYILLALNTWSLHAQDTLPNQQLKEITITTDRLTIYDAGTKTLRFDEKTLLQHRHRNLSDLLHDESPIFIKSYGMGGLATTSARGGSAQHTAIIWNGFQINNAATGQIDLSLIPMQSIGSVAIQYGGSCALWGSGAVGGAIHLQAKPTFGTPQWSAQASVTQGSFGQWTPQASFSYRTSTYYTSLSIQHQRATNNFSFTNIYQPNQPRSTQTNAALRANAALYEFHSKPNPHKNWNFALWYQDNHRQIPPTMLQNQNFAQQEDQSLRLTTEYSQLYTRWKWSVRAAKFIEKLRYHDAPAHIDDINKSYTGIAEIETKYNISASQSLHLGSNYTFSRANSDHFAANPQQSRFALFGGYAYQAPNQKWLANAAIRAENANKKNLPLTFSVGTDYAATPYLTIKAAATKLYRMPTLNDLYWVPGGNPDLRSESGYGQEIGLHSRFQISKKSDALLKIEATAFHRLMDDWILWLPGNNGYWTPRNIAKVRSSGIETTSSLSHTHRKTTFRYTVMTNYVLSTNLSGKGIGDAALGKQLIYTPIYSGKAKISIEHKQLSAAYTHQYTGYRYTTSDHSQHLAPFQLGGLYLQYQLSIKQNTIILQAHLHNIWDEAYQMLITRPMPGRNIQLGAKVQFNR